MNALHFIHPIRTDERTDRAYFIRPFRQPPGVQKGILTLLLMEVTRA